MGYSRHRNFQVKGRPSAATKMKKTTSVRPKLMREETLRESRNRYFGTFTLVKIPALAMREPIPPEVASLKYEYTRLPANM